MKVWLLVHGYYHEGEDVVEVYGYPPTAKEITEKIVFWRGLTGFEIDRLERMAQMCHDGDTYNYTGDRYFRLDFRDVKETPDE